MASPDFDVDRIWLNGREESINNPRLQNCLREVRKRAQLSPEMESWKLHICSKNNFPTAAGLASSAAGYACLSATLAKLYKVEGDISTIARSGSGSACRSVYGGFVRWYAGTDPNGSDSIAKQIAPPSHWPEMRILILVVNDERKKTSSALGMKNSVLTSELLKYRAEHCVPKRVEEMQQAIMDKNFEKFAELMIKDSNQMHAVCLDTTPPCFYLNNVSFGIIDLIHAYNEASKCVKVGYTNDAGPNTVLYLLEKNVPEVLGLLDYYFPSESMKNVEYKRGNPPQSFPLSKELISKINREKNQPGHLKYIIHTRVGDGPTYLENPREHLLDSKGLPVEL
ncbi:diphosphomevalonate decarboxylase isoform X2 [Diachasma alloeum]|nr:diphosphomevalonate decarboxylase isoform X2 [Diachasma alloeum]XP_015127137.1 diphosphomevalonate decarboxylase isoform X2 [Diachasma alloeum]